MSKCKKHPMMAMLEQLRALCKRMEAVEGAVATGYIYPKTLPADAVIVIRMKESISQTAMASIKEAIAGVWPDNKCVVFCDGMSMEVYEGGKKKKQRTICGACLYFGVCQEGKRGTVTKVEDCRILKEASNENSH